jgi:hypothetical protein
VEYSAKKEEEKIEKALAKQGKYCYTGRKEKARGTAAGFHAPRGKYKEKMRIFS